MKKMVEHVPVEALAMQDCIGRNVLHTLAISGSAKKQVAGQMKVAKALVTKNPVLTQIADQDGMVPLHLSCCSDDRELVWYLTLVTRDEHPTWPFTGPMASFLTSAVTYSGFHEICLYLVRQYPSLATAISEKGYTLLRGLADRASDFPSGSKLGFWENFIYQVVPVEFNYGPPSSMRGDEEAPHENSAQIAVQSLRTYFLQVFQFQKFEKLFWKALEQVAPCIKKVRDTKLRHRYAMELVEHIFAHAASSMNLSELLAFVQNGQSLTIAISSDIVEILRVCFHYVPDAVSISLPTLGGINLLQLAMFLRREKTFNFLCRMSDACPRMIANALLFESKFTIWHMVAQLPPTGSSQLSHVAGSALQLQRELQWFKAVEKFMCPVFREWKTPEGKTPEGKTAIEVFVEEHKGLREEGEKWMKDTSTSCMVVAILVASVMFSAAFTAPGGNHTDKGTPIFLSKTTFKVFAISDALSLFSSLTSVLIFLSLLTPRYAEKDFLEALPKRLILGLGSLFFSLATMMVAFGTALSIVLTQRLDWIYVPITLLACFPVAMFVILQLPLFIQMIRSTYGSGIFSP
ncbi:uncharacterized protein [Malus domestica]|uniref:uncharacterized protein n=1 Tax=Malus domestica TaxID=3750 RepID=UPI0039755E65